MPDEQNRVKQPGLSLLVVKTPTFYFRGPDCSIFYFEANGAVMDMHHRRMREKGRNERLFRLPDTRHLGLRDPSAGPLFAILHATLLIFPHGLIMVRQIVRKMRLSIPFRNKI